MKKQVVLLIMVQFIFAVISPAQNFTFHADAPFGIQVTRGDGSRGAQKVIFYDYDGDGDQDLLLSGLDQITSFDSWNDIHFFLEMQENIGDNHNPQFAPRDSIFEMLTLPRGYFLPSIGDLNNDGMPDFILGSDIDYIGNQTFLYAKGLGNNVFESTRMDSMGLPDFVPESVFMPELVDLDHDGDLDLIASGFMSAFAEEDGPDIPVFYYAKNNGSKNQPLFDGWYYYPYGLTPDPHIEMVTSGDIDNDGDIDFIGVTNLIPSDSLNHIYVHLNHPGQNGKPLFDTIPVASPFGLPTTFGATQLLSPDLVDIDGDGDLDLFVFEGNSQGLTLKYYENTLCIPTTTDVSQTICEGEVFTVGNESFSEPGEYNIHLENIQHCDSLVHLILDVLGPVSSNVEATICEGESYTVANETFTTSGNYMVHTITVAGCDSLIFLTLNVNPNSNTQLNETICEGESYSVGNESFSTTGNYMVLLSAANGCDSIVHLSLTVNETFNTPLTETICEGESYPIGNQSFDTPGHYDVVLSSQAGCDSTISLDLSVTHVDNSVTVIDILLTANLSGASYQWFDCDAGLIIPAETNQSFTPTATGNYAVSVTDGSGCSSLSACIPVIVSGIENASLSKAISIYPNPASEWITISNSNDLHVSALSLINLSGQLVKEVTNTNSGKMNISLLDNGIYFVKIKVNGFEITKKLIVLH